MKDGPLACLLKATPNFTIPSVFLLSKSDISWKMTVATEEEDYHFCQLGLGS